MWYIYICAYVHNLGSARKILWTQLRKENGHLGKLAIDTLASSMMKKTPADLKAKGKKPGSTRACLDSSCLGKDAGVLFRINYSIHQHTGIGCDTSS